MGMLAVGSNRTQLPSICSTLVMAELRVRIVLAVSCAPKYVPYPWCAAAWSALLRQSEHLISKFEWRWSTISEQDSQMHRRTRSNHHTKPIQPE